MTISLGSMILIQRVTLFPILPDMIEHLNTALALFSYLLLVCCCALLAYNVFGAYPWLAVAVGLMVLFLTYLFASTVKKCWAQKLSLSRVFVSNLKTDIVLAIIIPFYLLEFNLGKWHLFFMAAMTWLFVDIVRLNINQYTDARRH
ncbi:MAG: hypothetical protein EGR08_00315 [Prevotella sp.]|nr:hypothetical protein [Prevotella sp.]